MSAFGLLPFGTVAPWGGAGLISLLQILAVGTNELIAFFTDPPKVNDPLGYRDARRAANWEIVAVDPVEIGIGGEVIVEPGKPRPTKQVRISHVEADPLDPTQVHLFTVPQLEGGIEYDVTLAGAIRGANCEDFGGLATFRVAAPFLPPPKPGSRLAAQDTYRDWANPYFEIDPRTGKPTEGRRRWIYDDAGELELDSPRESLKKRVLRRIWTDEGAYSHMPTYGTRTIAHTLARPGDIQAFALRLQEQLREEPDVRDASVVATIEATAGGGLIRLVVNVQPKGISAVSFLVQIPASGAG